MYVVWWTGTQTAYHALQRTLLVTAVTRGHFEAVCLSKKQTAKHWSINEVADLVEVEVPFLGEVYSHKVDFWTTTVKVDGHETHFKLDTGAAVSIVSDKKPWLKDHQLNRSRF